jgi:hypothetical protein
MHPVGSQLISVAIGVDRDWQWTGFIHMHGDADANLALNASERAIFALAMIFSLTNPCKAGTQTATRRQSVLIFRPERMSAKPGLIADIHPGSSTSS